MVDNDDWLARLDYIPFLRDVGLHFTINRMLTFDSVKLRLDREQPLTFLEFNYMILQAYDFLELSRRVGCRLQMGGSDQWGNIVNGVDLARRIDGTELYGVTTPLITTADGGKMGKTAQGAVWLNRDQLGPYDYWQFWRNTQDADVGKFLRLFTDLPLDEIARLRRCRARDQRRQEDPRRRRDRDGAWRRGRDRGRRDRRKTFEERQPRRRRCRPPGRRQHQPRRRPGIGLGLVASKNEARRLIAQGGARVDGQAVDEDGPIAVTCDVRISAGKKKHGLLTP